MTKYYFILATENFLAEEEALEEVLRERVQYFRKQNKPNDFWILPNPSFLNTQDNKISTLKNKFTKPTMAIISTDKSFIVWLKLRCQNVVLGEFNGPSFSIKSPLEYNMKG
jgi:hypothetical protein